MGVNNFHKVVTRQRRGRELNLQPLSCKSNALAASYMYRLPHVCIHSGSCLVGTMPAVAAARTVAQALTVARHHCHHSFLTHRTGLPLTRRTQAPLRTCTSLLRHTRYSRHHETMQWLSSSFALTSVLNLLDRKGIESRGFAWNIFMFGRSGLTWSNWRKPGQLNNNKTSHLMSLYPERPG